MLTPALKRMIEAGTRSKDQERASSFSIHNLKRRETVTMRVMGVSPIGVTLECVTPGPQEGYQMTADYQRLRVWRGRIEDISKIQAGTEVTLEAVKHPVHSFLILEIKEWKHV